MSKTSTDWFSRPLASFISISFVVAYLLGGFVGGFFMCTSCATFDIEGRLVVSLLIGILSIVFGGFPPANEGGVGPALNTWPYILGCWACISIVRLVVRKKQATRE